MSNDILNRELEACAKVLAPLGFSSYHNNGMDWILTRGELIFRFYMCTEMSCLPVFAYFYGVHPRFIPLPLNPGKTATSFEGAYSKEVLSRIPPKTNAEFSSGIPESQKALETFFLPLTEKLQTSTDAYFFHKEQLSIYCERRQYLADNCWQSISGDFIDEALFFEDKQMYSQCKAAIVNNLLPHLEKVLDAERKINSAKTIAGAKKQLTSAKKGSKTKDHLLLCLDVIEGAQREAFVKEMRDAEKRNEQMLARHFFRTQSANRKSREK